MRANYLCNSLKARVPVILSILIIMMTGCGRSNSDKDAGRPVIAVSFGYQAWLLESIAGDNFKIVEILPRSADAEVFDPTVATMKSLQQSDYYLTTDTPGFEEKLADLLKENCPEIEIVDVKNGIKPILGTHQIANGHGHHHSADPHVMSSVRNVRIMADNMLNFLCKVDSGNTSEYVTNHGKLVARLDQLDSLITENVDWTLGNSQRKSFVVIHPMLSYFARDYGLEQISLEESGKESSPRHIMESMDKAANAGALAMVVEEGSVTPQMAEMAEHVGIPVYEINLTGRQWYDNMSSFNKFLSRQARKYTR